MKELLNNKRLCVIIEFILLFTLPLIPIILGGLR